MYLCTGPLFIIAVIQFGPRRRLIDWRVVLLLFVTMQSGRRIASSCRRRRRREVARQPRARASDDHCHS